MGAARQQLLTFRAGDRRLGMAAESVREVRRLPRLTAVPLAPSSLLGVGNVRGEATAIISAARLLDLPDGRMQRIILLEGEQPIALAIDRIEGIVAESDCEMPAFADLLATSFPPREGSARSVGDAKSLTRSNEDVERLALLSVAVGDQRFAFALEDIESLISVPRQIAKMPLSDAATLGTIAWRDMTVPLFSLAALLALPEARSSAARIVIVRLGGQFLGVLVDRVDALLRPQVNRVDPVPHALLRGGAEAVIQAIYRPDLGGPLVSILAVDRLLAENMTPAPAAVSSPSLPELASQDQRALLLFTSNGQRFALPVEALHEVTGLPARFASVPNAPDFLPGLAAHRGEPVLVVDLARHLGGSAASGKTRRLLIVTIGGARAALLVDAVHGISRVSTASIQEPPPMGDAAARQFGAVVSLDGGKTATLVLAADDLFADVEANLLKSFLRRAVSTA